ncbi:MAG: MASE1 domain-containing protein [Actinomycetota bacterium]
MDASGWTASRARGRDLIIRAAILAVAYFLGAKLGLRLAYSNENITSVWPPTGIAVAGLLLFGPRVWPGITVGALVANLTNGAPLATTLGICVGNTLAPIVGAALLRRTGFRPALDRLRDVVLLVLLGGLASMLISATGGTLSLIATDAIGREGAGLAWLVWWVGDALGVVLFAPLILTFATPLDEADPIATRPREGTILVGTTVVVALLVFGTHIPLVYLLFPFAIWAAVRFHQRGTSALILLVSGIAILETTAGNGPFTGMSRTTNLMSLQAFNGSVALAALSLAAVTRERARAQAALRRSADELEERVIVRTAELTTSEERLQEAQRLAHIGSWHWDVSTNSVTWTDELYRIYGLEPKAGAATFEAYVGHVHPDHRDQVTAAVEGTLATGDAFEHEYRIVRPDGEVRWVHARGEALTDAASGERLGLRGYCHDVTQRREAEDVLRRSLDGEREAGRRLRMLDEFKDSLLTAVSHELRTPLTVIMGLSSTMTDHSVALTDEEKEDLIERLDANARRLDRLLADLLDVDRLNRGVIEPRPRATALEMVARRTLASMEMNEHPVSIDLGTEMVAADPAHLERIVENLLSNAAKHTPAHTAIHVRSEDAPDGVVLIVEDSGPGVPPSLREDIFEPFRRGDFASHVQGTGVGLSLVARFARVNGGRAWVEERDGGGASFRVLLPRATTPQESPQNV